MAMDLGEKPQPEIEPGEPAPGGVDAIEENPFDEPPVVPDLTQVGNSEGKDELPEELTEPEDTETEATSGEESDAQKESPE
jgi:hypothetical protein